jgi:hypothetical protein
MLQLVPMVNAQPQRQRSPVQPILIMYAVLLAYQDTYVYCLMMRPEYDLTE